MDPFLKNFTVTEKNIFNLFLLTEGKVPQIPLLKTLYCKQIQLTYLQFNLGVHSHLLLISSSSNSLSVSISSGACREDNLF